MQHTPSVVQFQEESPRLSSASDRSSLAVVSSNSASRATSSPSAVVRPGSTQFENLLKTLQHAHDREVHGLRSEVERLHAVVRAASVADEVASGSSDVAAMQNPRPPKEESQDSTWQSISVASDSHQVQPPYRAAYTIRMSKQSAALGLDRNAGDATEPEEYTPKGTWKLDEDQNDNAELPGPGITLQLTMDTALTRTTTPGSAPSAEGASNAKTASQKGTGQRAIHDSLAVGNGMDTVNSVDFAGGRKRPPPTGIRGFARRLVVNPLFDPVFAVLVILDTVNNGIEVELRSNYPNTELGLDMVQVARYVLNFLFVFEVCLRFLSDGHDFFYSSNWKWNLFDVAIVALSFIEMTMMLAEPDPDEDDNAKATGVRAVRIVRAVRSSVRTIRVVRMVRFFTELRQMLAAILGSLRSMFWLAVLLLLILYLFAIIFTGGATEYLRHNAETVLETQYGTLGRSIYTLYKAMSNGQDWGELTPALSKAGWVYGLLFIMYISFTVFALLNAVTSVFVNNALQATAQEHDLAAEQEDANKNKNVKLLQRLFQRVDHSGSGTVSMEELITHLQRDEVRTALQVFGIHNNEAESLFKLLDVNDGGEVDINGFVVGCMRLRGEARSIDIAELRKLIIKILARLHDMMIFMEEVSPYAKTRLTARHAAPAIDLRRTMGDTYSSRWTRFNG